MKPLRALTAMTLVFVLLLAACSSADPYRSDFAKWTAHLNATIRRDLPFGKTTLTQSEAADLSSALHDLTSRLAKMKPPSLVRSEHQELLGDLIANGQTLETWGAAMGSSPEEVNIGDVLGGRLGSPGVLELVAQIQNKLAQ